MGRSSSSSGHCVCVCVFIRRRDGYLFVFEQFLCVCVSAFGRRRKLTIRRKNFSNSFFCCWCVCVCESVDIVNRLDNTTRLGMVGIRGTVSGQGCFYLVDRGREREKCSDEREWRGGRRRGEGKVVCENVASLIMVYLF